MSMNYERVSQGLPEKEVAQYAAGIGLVKDFVNSLRAKNLLPEEFSNPEVVVSAAPQTTETGHYVDKGSIASRLYGSCDGSDVVIARFPSDSRLHVLWDLDPQAFLLGPG